MRMPDYRTSTHPWQARPQPQPTGQELTSACCSDLVTTISVRGLHALAPAKEFGMDFEFKAATDAVLGFVHNHQAWAIPVVFVLAFGESLAFISLVLPFFTILIAIGTIIGASGSLNFWSILISAAIGAALGDWLSYWLGVHYHRQIAAMWPLSKYPDLLPAGERFFRRWGAWAIVLGRFTGPLRASVPIMAGAARMPSLLFQIANWPSAVLWAAVLLTVGDNLGQLLTSALKIIGRD